jgi:intein-encoded DNA endonuclease-like protein
MDLSVENSKVINSEYLNKILYPYYVTGFVDGEGCFLINVPSRSDQKLGYNVNLMFKIKLHSKDKVLLEKIRDYFGVGNITIRKNGYVEYIVSSKKDIEVIINHFDSYPLITQK